MVEIRERRVVPGALEMQKTRSRGMNVKMPRKRDILYSALFSAVAIDLCVKAHDVWEIGQIGWAWFYVAGGLSAVMSVIQRAAKCCR